MYSGDLLRTCSEDLHGINTRRPGDQQSEYLGKDVSKLVKEREKKSEDRERWGLHTAVAVAAVAAAAGSKTFVMCSWAKHRHSKLLSYTGEHVLSVHTHACAHTHIHTRGHYVAHILM